jgi:hypothetical protein
MHGKEFGFFENVRWDERSKSVVGELVLYDNPAGNWAGALLTSLRAQGRLGSVGLAADMDVERNGEEVTRIVSVHSIALVVRPSAGGRFAGGPTKRKKSKRVRRRAIADARALVATVGPAPEGVRILADPSRAPAKRNADGTWRVVNYIALHPDPHAARRLRRIARTLHGSEEYGAVVAGDVFDRFDALARVVRAAATLDRGDLEGEIRNYHRLGVTEETTAPKAVRRHLHRARAAEAREDLIEDPDAFAGRDLLPETLAALREVRNVIDELRGADPAAYAEALYHMQREGNGKGRHSGEGRAEFARLHGVTEEAMRSAVVRLRRHLARFFRAA